MLDSVYPSSKSSNDHIARKFEFLNKEVSYMLLNYFWTADLSVFIIWMVPLIFLAVSGDSFLRH